MNGPLTGPLTLKLTVGLLFSVVTVSTASQDGAVSNVAFESISSVLQFTKKCVCPSSVQPPLPSSTPPPPSLAATRAYIVNQNSYNISICTVSGEQLTCGQQVHLNSSSVMGIALSPDGQTAYIVNPRSNSVTVCSILADNTLKCGDPTGSNMANPLGIAISPDGTKAYVTNYNNSGYLYTVTVCSISGFDFTCSKPTGSNLKLPWGIALSSDGSKAYVANEASTPLGAVTVCQVLGDILTNCQLTAFQNPSASLVGIAISPDGSTAYFSNSYNNTITICNVSDYTFDCGPQLNPNSTTFKNPRFISLSRDGLQLFVTNSRSNKVSVCSVSGQELGPCNNTRSNTYLPEGIAVY